jgi:endonuclease YncB( thermonuclease family)
MADLALAREYPVLGLQEVHDGDTWRLMLDVGFEHAAFPWLRMKGWSCPELNEQGGQEARGAAEALLFDAAGAGMLWVRTFKRPGYEDMRKSFARYLAEVYVGSFERRDGPALGELLAAAGHATRTAG